MTILDIVATLILFSGAFFILIASIGIVRLPDFYTRAHAAGKGDTLGILLFLIGLAVYDGGLLNVLKLILIAVFIGIANPTATHAIVRVAYKLGFSPLLSSSKNENKTNPEE
jgi:multicomponent Na+:H+ antiporter subunit G